MTRFDTSSGAIEDEAVRARRIESVVSPREDQGVRDALGKAFGCRPADLSAEWFRLLNRIR